MYVMPSTVPAGRHPAAMHRIGTSMGKVFRYGRFGMFQTSPGFLPVECAAASECADGSVAGPRFRQLPAASMDMPPARPVGPADEDVEPTGLQVTGPGLAEDRHRARLDLHRQENQFR